MAGPAEDKSIGTIASAAAKDLLIGLAVGTGLYVLWVLLHSILFG